MERFAKRLRQRARELELSDAEVARRAGLAERRYGHYVRGNREPDFETLLRICTVLDVTPNDLLIAAERAAAPEHDRWLSRLIAMARKLGASDLKLAVRQIEALWHHRETMTGDDQPDHQRLDSPS
jgi:transcriptional regulator with XRE-family HTH domain